MSAFLERALMLRAHGYRVIPIRHGSKAPEITGWQEKDLTEDQLRHYAKNGYGNGNIGIVTRDTPAIDIDVYDATFAQEMDDWCRHELGETLTRVGRTPKRLLLFRTDVPFRKMLCEYSDGARRHRIEILGAGQQFVAYGIHPDTKRPYTWTSFDQPLDFNASDLPTLDTDQCERVLDQFEAMCKLRGWTKTQRTGHARLAASVEDGTAFDRMKPVLAITKEKVLDTLDYIPNDNADYDTWLLVGCALHHQFGGSEEGLQLWHEWGAKSPKYEPTTTNYKYGSFGDGPDTATFASLIHMANEKRAEESEQAFEAALNRVRLAADMKELMGSALKLVAEAAQGDLQVDVACKRVQERAQELTDVKPRLETIRKQFNAAKPKLDLTKRDIPHWCEDWVFVTRYGEFYNTESGQRLNRSNFDSAYGRFLLTDVQRAAGEVFAGKASDAALNLHELPQVYDYVYLPGETRFVKLNRNMCVNTYNLSSVPPARQPTSPDDYEAIRLVERHFEILFPEKREREFLLDYLTFNVQFPAEKITWAVLIQGVDGAGKTWFADLMAACIGGENVRSVNGSSLKETYTSWAEGRKMVFIEEIRLHDNNRFEIIDKIKPYVTNVTAPVRRMRQDGYEVPNVTNYVMFTNHPDALPISKSDRRYFIIRTAFQTKSHIDLFLQQNPDYFANLYNALSFNGDVIRDWFLKRRISDAFRAKGHAPDTEAKDLMRGEAEGRDDSMSALEEVINEGANPLISEAVLCAAELRSHPVLSVLPSRTLGMLLARAGFAAIGKFRINGTSSEPNLTYYTRRSELFPGEQADKLQKLRELVNFDDGF